MRFYFDLKKIHVFVIIALVAIAGFAIAQTPPNPGHMAGGILVNGLGDLQTWVTNANGALNGHEQRITTLETPSLPGANLMEGRRYDIGSQQTIFTASAPFFISNLAQYADVYTGGTDRGGYRGYVGCLSGITSYCQNEGYYTASILHPTCGAAFGGDSACPNVPGCTITFYCLKRHI